MDEFGLLKSKTGTGFELCRPGGPIWARSREIIMHAWARPCLDMCVQRRVAAAIETKSKTTKPVDFHTSNLDFSSP